MVKISDTAAALKKRLERMEKSSERDRQVVKRQNTQA
jgi:hypothetical protein